MNTLCELLGHQLSAQVLYTIITKALWVAFIIVIGFVAISFITRLVMRALRSAKRSPHVQVITQKIIFYIGVITIIINTAHVFGFDVSVLLGAAGVAGVAIGFASQTSMSNLISGLFLLSEQFLKIGDQIVCDSVEGTVTSIDLFSVKVRTADGKLVRIPNERLLQTHVIDVTYYKARQAQIALAVPADIPLDKVLSVVDKIIMQSELLDRDATKAHYQRKHPALQLESLSNDAQHLTIKVWATHESFAEMQNTLMLQIHAALTQAGLKPLYVNRY